MHTVLKASTIVTLRPEVIPGVFSPGASQDHCVGLKVAQQTILLFAQTLREPSGGHCVELNGGSHVREARHTLGALRAPSMSGLFVLIF